MFENWPEGAAAEALALMERALEILDSLEGADKVAAHLDLAVSRLQEALARDQGPRLQEF